MLTVLNYLFSATSDLISCNHTVDGDIMYPHFPFRDLDISCYTSNTNQNGIYNLIAVICHSGSIDGGHCEFSLLYMFTIMFCE